MKYELEIIRKEMILAYDKSQAERTNCQSFVGNRIQIFRLCDKSTNICSFLKVIITHNYTFFSPGATTPNGGCILQPCSRL